MGEEERYLETKGGERELEIERERKIEIEREREREREWEVGNDERTQKLEISVIRVTLHFLDGVLRMSTYRTLLDEKQGKAQFLFRRKDKAHCFGASTIFFFKS